MRASRGFGTAMEKVQALGGCFLFCWQVSVMVMLHYSRLLSWEVVSFLMVLRGGYMAQANVSVDLPTEVHS